MSGGRREKYRWYLRRLSRMSVAEIAHRLAEQLKRRRDGRRDWSWAQFGQFPGRLTGLPGPAPAAGGDGRDAAQGHFRFLGQDWPPPAPDWERSVWHLDPVTRTRWPGRELFAFDVPYRHAPAKGDVKFVWEINRLQFLQDLAQAGDFGRISALLDGWMAENPPYRGINWVSGIEAASRLVSLLVVLARGDDAARAALDGRARAFLQAHAFWLARYPSRFSSANNHLVSELAALFLAGLCAPGMPRADQYLAEGRAGLEQEILKQIFSDGVGAEQSPTYTAYSLEWFLLAATAADAAGQPFSAAYRARIEAAVRHFRWLMDDAGHVPRIGDDDEGRVLSYAGSPEDYVAAIVHRAEAWLGDSIQPGIGAQTFPQGGYTVMRRRAGADTLIATLDHAPLGYLSIAAHGHADALSLWLHWGEEAIFADAGTYLYHSGGDWRDRFRGTAVHNTLTLGEADQSLIAGPFNWSAHAQTQVTGCTPHSITVQHDGYRARFGLVHARTLDWSDADRLTIEDRLVGHAPTVLSWSVGFLLAPGVQAVLDGRCARLTTPAGRTLTAELPEGRHWLLETCPYSPRFNEKRETLRLCVRGEAGGTDPLLLRISWHWYGLT